jgi:uncharacterized protein (DUF2164 family)
VTGRAPKDSTRIQLSPERRAELIEALQSFYADLFGDELSDYRSGELLDFFVKELGPPVYNQAIQDARGYMAERLADLEAEFYEPDGDSQQAP